MATVSDLFDRFYGGWLAQIVGGAFGTAVEGYSTEVIRRAFGEVHGYVRPPNTYNDDITYELAFLEAFRMKGYNVTAADIALEWVSRIPAGWSAEGVALSNLRLGIFPPESGRHGNPYCECIGAQMRGAICGLVSPGNPLMAARLAFENGSISHANNGILGEVFNALLVSLSFAAADVVELLQSTIQLIPAKSEYYEVITFAYGQCTEKGNWEDAWRACDERFKEYHWIHAYPNAAAEVIALFFSGNSFDRCMHVIGMEGLDVDCNAAQIGTVFGVMFGKQAVARSWVEPVGDSVLSYMRRWEEASITQIARMTFDAAVAAMT
jgi:ADP-ribosylglycohydrolase